MTRRALFQLVLGACLPWRHRQTRLDVPWAMQSGIIAASAGDLLGNDGLGHAAWRHGVGVETFCAGQLLAERPRKTADALD